jgi:hypothetical protein
MSQHTVKAEKDQQTHATLGTTHRTKTTTTKQHNTQNEDNNNKTTQHRQLSTYLIHVDL